MKLYARLGLVLFAAATLLLTSAAYAQGPPVTGADDLLTTPSTKKDLYPADADATKDIRKALQRAGVAHKRVLLVFGGNWCYDCHVLDHALHEGAAGEIMTASFLLVHVDIGEADKNLDLAKKYKIPLEKGVPAVVVLANDGSLLYSSGLGEFEAARTMLRKDLIAFLKRWQEGK